MLSPSVKYTTAAILGWPMLPLMYLQGKTIKKSVPVLPKARNPIGLVKGSSSEVIQMISIGESTIAGVGVDQHEQGFTAALAQTLAQETGKSVAWRVWARSGYTTRRVYQKIVPKIDQQPLDLIVIGLGGNDAFNLNAPWVWQRDVKQLLVGLRQQYPGTPIVFANMPPIKDFPAFTKLIQFTVGNLVELLGEQLQKIVSNQEHTYYHNEVIKLKYWLQKYPGTTPQDFFSDGVHPSALTYQVWGSELARYVLKHCSF